MKGNRKSTKIVEYQLICIDYRWICINYQALVLETFFCLSKRWLFLICDIILDYREALVFYRIFSTLVINFFEFLKFGSKSIEKSIENRYQSTSVTVNFTDNRDYRAVFVFHGRHPGSRRHEREQRKRIGLRGIGRERFRSRAYGCGRLRLAARWSRASRGATHEQLSLKGVEAGRVPMRCYGFT